MDRNELLRQVQELTGMDFDTFTADCERWAEEVMEVTPGVWRRLVKEDIKPGMVFDTAFETMCVATSVPDETNSFDAIDSDGVEVSCSVVMVKKVHHS